MAGDKSRIRGVTEALIAEERGKQHHVLAEQLSTSLNGRPDASKGQLVRAVHHVWETEARWRLSDLVLPPRVLTALWELIEEQRRVDLLRSYGIEPRHRILMTGPPGNGKTASAEALSAELMVPLFTVRYETLIGSFLGETGGHLSELFDNIRTHRCVLFFDEFDAIAKERGDEHETGEIKRVVSSLLLQIDRLPSHVVVIAATNHPELLDRAVWRRFQVRLELPRPTVTAIQRFLEGLAENSDLELGYAPRTLAQQLRGLNFSDVEEFVLDCMRTYVLSLPDGDLRRITSSKLDQWRPRIRKP